MRSPSTSVAAAAAAVQRYQLESQPRRRIRHGLPVHEFRSCAIEHAEKDAAVASNFLKDLALVDRASLSHDEALTAACLDVALTLVVEQAEYAWYEFPVTSYALSDLAFYLNTILLQCPLHTPRDAERYLSLVAQYVDVVDALGVKLDGQAERGIRLPRAAVPSARESLSRLRRSSRDLIVPSASRTSTLHAAGAGLRARVERLLIDEVEPAFERVLARLGPDAEALAPESVGASQYPGGPDYYRFAIRRNTSLDAEPEHLHELGLEQVADLTEQMAQARSDAGFRGTEAEYHAYLLAQPHLYAATPLEVESRYLAHLARIEPALSECFTRLPEAPYSVARLDPALEPGMTYGYYEPPTAADPVGRYRYNGSELQGRSMLSSASLIYHELAPGHHFHLARQLENPDLPELRRDGLDYDTYDEGWAEYAAGVAGELGGYADAQDAYGRLVHERFTAARLVLDTGLNALGWPLARARSYMRNTTLESEAQIVSETLRYSTALPGQALGYRLGYLTFRRLREDTQARLGPRFRLPDFHEAILAAGALPLSVLEDHITWFAGNRSQAEAQ